MQPILRLFCAVALLSAFLSSCESDPPPNRRQLRRERAEARRERALGAPPPADPAVRGPAMQPY